MEPGNPYAAPTAEVSRSPEDASVSFAGTARRVSAGRGAAWINQGFAILMAAPGGWLAIGLIMILLNVLPQVGAYVWPPLQLLGFLLFPLFVLLQGGVMHALASNGSFGIERVAAGARRAAKPLIGLSVLGILYSTLILVVAGIASGFPTEAFTADLANDPEAMNRLFGASFGSLILILLVGMTPLVMVLWFAPGLISVGRFSVGRAIGESLRASLRNWLPFLVLGIVGLILFVIALFLVGILMGALTALLLGAGISVDPESPAFLLLMLVVYVIVTPIFTALFYGAIFASLRDLYLPLTAADS